MPDGYPIIRPKIHLLYKAKAVREKNVQDFLICLPRMSREQKNWLSKALERGDPGHSWIKHLEIA
jgi:hypothetical protein